MRSIIFANKVASDTRQLGATIDVETTKVKFLGNLRLDVWDCAGQSSYFDEFLTNRQDTMFRQVHSMIYIFDVESPAFSTSDADYFYRCLLALKASSGRPAPSEYQETGPFVHVLIHKMDLVPIGTRDTVFKSKSEDIRKKCIEAGWPSVKIFGTSIWNETLYRAWSTIVSTFIPNISALKRHLDSFATACKADEVVLFENTTFLVISRTTNQNVEQEMQWEDDRFEKICQCIKMFRLSCSYLLRTNFDKMEIKHRAYSAVLSTLTPNTYIMVISTDPGIQPAGIALNIKLSSKHFTKLQATTFN